jgi:hypothetical protein
MGTCFISSNLARVLDGCFTRKRSSHGHPIGDNLLRLDHRTLDHRTFDHRT